MSGISFNPREAARNPIWVKSVRSRLRSKHIMSWGLIALTVTAFISVITYLPAVERGIPSQDAAKLMVIPIIIIQGVFLMLLGTGAVASQLAIEREKGLLDYQRMTPMSPSAKIIGYLFGLPIREYFLFALTLPFLAFAVTVGDIGILNIGQFYLVFISSITLYHMTGMVAGMASSKPRQAAMMSQGLVILLYLVLPQLSRFGLTFFEYLTVRPTFFSMVSDELALANPGIQAAAQQQFGGLNQTGNVPFFNLEMNPTVFTIMLQFFIITFMYRVVQRKWHDEFSHPFSKLNALTFYAGVIFLVVGSLWPVLGDEKLSNRLIAQFSTGDTMPAAVFLFSVLLTLLFVCGVATLLMIAMTTPNCHTQIRELRRARKLGLHRAPSNTDGASSLPMTLAIATLTIAVYFAILKHADATGWYLQKMGGLWDMLAPVLYLAAAALFMQAVRQRFAARAFFVSMFLLWMLPFFTLIIFYAAFEAWVVGSYAGVICPPIGLWLGLANFFEQSKQLSPEQVPFAPPEVIPHLRALTLLGVGFYATLAAVFQWRLHLWQLKRRQSEIDATTPLLNPAKQSDP